METIVEENKHHGGDSDQMSENILSRLNKGYKRSKAEQILRLLKDQEALTNKFKEYDLADGNEAQDEKGNESDYWSLAGSDASSVKEVEVKPRKLLKKQKSGRSKTSMGFHENEFSDFSSDSETDDKYVRTENDVPKSKLSRHQSLNIRNKSRGHFDDYSGDMRTPGDFDVISIKSSRPKSSIASFSARSRRPNRLSDTAMLIQSPRADDPEVNKQRKRISNVKVDPLFRRAGVHSFGEKERKDNTKADNCHTPTNLTPRYSSSRKIAPTDLDPLERTTTLAYDAGRPQGRPVCRSTSLAERGKYADKVTRPSRSVLSVDSNPLQSPREPIPNHGGLRRPSPLQTSSGEVTQGQSIRRPKSGPRNGRRYSDVSKSNGRTSLNVISERSQPVAVMKLPPLDPSLKKAVPERDIICYGKEAMV